MRSLKVFSSLLLVPVLLCFSGCENNTSQDPDPIVSFSMDNKDGSVGDIITFTNTTKYASSYEWDFGDGRTSTEENPTHAYSVHGGYTIKLLATGEGGTGSVSDFIYIWDLVLVSTFYGDSIDFQGPAKFEAQPVKLIFNNECSYAAVAGIWKHHEGYSHDIMLQRFEDGTSAGHHPMWTDFIGFDEEVSSGDSHSWVWYVDPGLYTLVSCRMMPYLAWYVAGLTVSE